MTRSFKPDLPPLRSSASSQALIDAAARGRFQLPCCTVCGRFTWPVPELCPHCLSDVTLADAPRKSRLLSRTEVLAPATPYFRSSPAWQVGLILLAGEVPALAFLHPDARVGEELVTDLLLDRSGQAVLYAAPASGSAAVDILRKEFGMVPEGQTVLITDVTHPATAALVHMLHEIGAARVYGGVRDDAPDSVPDGLEPIALDPRNTASVRACADRIGGDVGLVVNTLDCPQSGGFSNHADAEDCTEVMDVVAGGLHRLVTAFAPCLRARACGPCRPAGWVHLGSVHALAGPPELAGHSAAHAAALSFCRSLRADCLPLGLKVMTVLSGAFVGDVTAGTDMPLVRPDAFARALKTALRDGREDVVVGDYAQDLVRRHDLSPKATERGFAGRAPA